MIDIVDQCPVFVVDVTLAEANVEILGDHSLHDLGTVAQQIMQRQMEGLKLLRDILAFQLVASLDAFIDRLPHDLPGNK